MCPTPPPQSHSLPKATLTRSLLQSTPPPAGDSAALPTRALGLRPPLSPSVAAEDTAIALGSFGESAVALGCRRLPYGATLIYLAAPSTHRYSWRMLGRAPMQIADF